MENEGEEPGGVVSASGTLAPTHLLTNKYTDMQDQKKVGRMDAGVQDPSIASCRALTKPDSKGLNALEGTGDRYRQES